MGGGLNQMGMTQQASSQYYQPYFDSIAQRANALGNMPFQSYGQAPGANGYTTQAAEGYANFQPAAQFGQATDMLSGAYGGLQGLGNYSAGSISNPYSANMIGLYDRPDDTSMFARPDNIGIYGAPQQLQMFGRPDALQMFARPDDVASTFNPESFTAEGTASKYMNPYTQGVTDIQRREADRAFALQQQQRQANAVQQGAFGGSRAALVDQAAQRDQNMLLDDIEKKGLDSAWQQAMQQFNQEQQAKALSSQMGLDASKFNSNLGMQYGLAGLGAQQFERQMDMDYGKTGLQTAQNNIQNSMQYGRDVLNKDMFNTNLAMDYGKTGLLNDQFNVNKNMQYGRDLLNKDMFNEGSRQKEGQMSLQAMIEQEMANNRAYNSNVGRYSGMGGLGSSMAGIGSALGNQQLAALGGLASTGNSLWGQDFQADNANYNRFMTDQMWPMQQLSWEKSIMQGLPGPTLTSTQYGGAGPQPWQQGLGNLAMAAGLYR